MTEDRVRALLAVAKETELRAELAAALAAHPKPVAGGELVDHLERESLDVQRAAIASMGLSRHARHIDFLIRRLTESQLRRDARKSLALYGDPIVPTILFELDNAERSLRLREALAKVLEDVGTQAATDALIVHLSANDPTLRRVVLRSLSRLRQANPDLIFTKDSVDRALMADTERYYDLARGIDLPWSDAPHEQLLRRALGEKQRETLEDMFLLLGLRHPAKDIATAYQGIQSSTPRIRASALEFLENVLKTRFKPLVLPILDASERGVADVGRQLFPKALDDRADLLAYLMKNGDPWLRACSVYCVRGTDAEPLGTLVEAATRDPDPIVRETAETVMSQRRRADGHR